MRYTALLVVKALKYTVLVGVPMGYASGSQAWSGIAAAFTAKPRKMSQDAAPSSPI
jgi:hypothetical protein